MLGVESSGFSNADLEDDVVNSFEELESIADVTDVASEAVSAIVVTNEITGLGPLSIVGLFFGIF